MANFENITIEKGMYQQKGKTLTDVLETLDPSENYKGTALSNLDAFSRQLKRFDIKVNGSGSDCVEKFFQSSDSAALFPEYVSRAVRQGMERADILPQIVATVTNIDGMDYRSIESDMTDDDKTLKPVGEGAVIPQTKIKTRENLVKLHKRGRMLVASYEAVRFQRIDLFTVTLRRIGEYIARAQLKDAIDVLVNGERILLVDRATESINSLDEISTKDLAIAIKAENEDNRYEFYKEVKVNERNIIQR